MGLTRAFLHSDFDLKKSSFKDQTITWYKDGTKFHQVTGKQIGKESIWKTFARSPLYIIINVAVGGDFVSSKIPPHLASLNIVADM